MATGRTIAAAVSLLLWSLRALVAGQTAAGNEFYTTLEVVPYHLPVSPPQLLVVFYRGDISIVGGETYEPSQLREPPMFSWQFEDGRNYTVLMIDFDVPSRDFPFQMPILHFLAMHITGNEVYRSDVVFDYLPPSPIPFTGKHRYCFFAYEETSTTKSASFLDRLALKRFDFNLASFVDEYSLVEIPIAGNCLLAQFTGF